MKFVLTWQNKIGEVIVKKTITDVQIGDVISLSPVTPQLKLLAGTSFTFPFLNEIAKEKMSEICCFEIHVLLDGWEE
jgi:hypothetical protein